MWGPRPLFGRHKQLPERTMREAAIDPSVARRHAFLMDRLEPLLILLLVVPSLASGAACAALTLGVCRVLDLGRARKAVAMAWWLALSAILWIGANHLFSSRRADAGVRRSNPGMDFRGSARPHGGKVDSGLEARRAQPLIRRQTSMIPAARAAADRRPSGSQTRIWTFRSPLPLRGSSHWFMCRRPLTAGAAERLQVWLLEQCCSGMFRATLIMAPERCRR